jgi:hypothetical protein
MKHRRLCHALAILLCLSVPAAARAASYFVSTTGSNSASGSSSAPWRTLQYAAGRVAPGDTVTVKPGSYAGFYLETSGTAAAPIRFVGQPGAIINAANPVTPDGINLEGASYVVVEGFQIRNVTRAGIRAVLCDHVTIRKNKADQNGRWGIFTGHCDDLLIEDNETSRSTNEHGIYVSNSGDRPVVRRNVVWGNRLCGIQLNADGGEGGDGVISQALLEGNIIFDNGAGGGAAINFDGVQSSVVRNNLLHGNLANGIALFRIDGSQSSRNNKILGNTIVMPGPNRWALRIVDGSTGNVVLNNVLYNAHTTRGSINISSDSRSGFRSDYNAVVNRFTTNDGSTVLSLSAWRSATGQDMHSMVVTLPALFVDAATDDYHMKATSPAVEAGTNEELTATDLDGEPRLVGAKVDIGCFELCPGGDCTPTDPEPPPTGGCPVPTSGPSTPTDVDGAGAEAGAPVVGGCSAAGGSGSGTATAVLLLLAAFMLCRAERRLRAWR